MNACPFLPTRCMGFFFRGVSARSSWFDSCTKYLQVREERKAVRPKNRSEQVLLLRSLIDEASELPPIPLSPAYQRRWALEFEGQSLKTYRRLPEDSRYCSLQVFQHLHRSCATATVTNAPTVHTQGQMARVRPVCGKICFCCSTYRPPQVTAHVLMLGVCSTDSFPLCCEDGRSNPARQRRRPRQTLCLSQPSFTVT